MRSKTFQIAKPQNVAHCHGLHSPDSKPPCKMKAYKVKSEDARYFSLLKDGMEIGRLNYEKWFSFKAELTLGQTETYQVEPQGFWGTTIELKQNEKILLDFKMNWNGSIIINTRFDDTERDFVFKQKGVLKSIYVLLDADGQELLAIEPDFKWSKFNYDYDITTTDEFDDFRFNELLILVAIHAANYYMAMMAAVIA